MDITYVCVIIGGTKKKIKINCIEGGGPSNGAKTARVGRKVTQTVNLNKKEKRVPPMDITYVCIIIGGITKKIKIIFIQGGRPLYRAKTVTD